MAIPSLKYQLIIYILAINMTLTSCSVETDSISLEDIYYLNIFRGPYNLSSGGIQILNNTDCIFLVSPSPLFNNNFEFIIDNNGTVNINNSHSFFISDFLYALNQDNNSAIFEIKSPNENQSGTLVKQNRFLKITFDQQTNLYIPKEFANSSENAEQLSTDILFATPIL